MNPSRRKTHRRGYTLMEMLIASLAASVLIAGLSSSLYVAIQATETTATPTSARIEGNAASRELLADLEFALDVSERTATAITFTIPDRDGDFNPETIRYAWSGTPGDPLTRQYNGGVVATLVENVHVFQHDLPIAKPNLLQNAGMEAGTANWEAITGATLSSSSSFARSGSLSLYAAQTSSSNESGLRQDVTSLLTNGTRYQISAWMRKLNPASPFDVKLQLRINSTGSGQQVLASSSFPINNSRFLRIKGTVTPAWSGTLLSAYWESIGTAKIQEIYVDDAELREKPRSDQNVNFQLQVGSDPQSLIHSGQRLLNTPL